MALVSGEKPRSMSCASARSGSSPPSPRWHVSTESNLGPPSAGAVVSKQQATAPSSPAAVTSSSRVRNPVAVEAVGSHPIGDGVAPSCTPVARSLVSAR